MTRPASQLLSDYEDAMFDFATYQVVQGPDEEAQMLESRRLFAQVRRLRAEILDRLEPA